MTPHPKGETIFRTNASKGAERGRKSHLRSSESVGASLEVRHELALLNAQHGFEIKALHNRREIQVMNLRELSRTQTVVAIVSGPMVLCAKGYS